MKRHLPKAGAGLTTLGLGGIVAYWIAVATTSGRHSPILFWVFGILAAVGIVGYLAGQDRPALSAAHADTDTASIPSQPGDLEQQESWTETYSVGAESEPEVTDALRGETFTCAWRHTSDGFEASPLMNMANLAMPGYFGTDNRPFLQVGVTIV